MKRGRPHGRRDVWGVGRAGVELGYSRRRYVDTLPNPQVDSCTELDLRVGWRLMDGLELSIVGEHLLHGSHAEFVPSSPSARDIERSAYGKFTWRR